MVSAEQHHTSEQAQVNEPEPPSEQPIQAGERHSVFSPKQKTVIVILASIAAFFSPLSANIYFPALNTIAHDLNVSNSRINLTVTTYLIFQGLAPTFTGVFSDNAGRRPAYIVCFIIYIAANVGLALQNNYAALLVLRCIQSSGSSGTVAIANAVVADVVTSAERGKYIGFTSIAPMLGPSLSPVIGGLLSQYLGWKWIFWFLVIFATSFFLPLLIILPETCRKIVGNGSIPPPIWNHSLLSFLEERKRIKAGDAVDFTQRDALAKDRRLRFPNPLATLVIVFDKGASLILFAIALLFSCFYIILSSIPSQFNQIYGFNDVQISLVFIPIGVGALISAFTTGMMIDWNFRRHAKRLGIPIVKNQQHDLSNFPIEKARLEVAMPIVYISTASMIAYGWLLHFRTNLVGPCIFLFILGYTLIAAFNSLNILIVDFYRKSPATATAATNLVRCLLGAGASAIVIPMIDAMGTGWAYTLSALVWVAFSPVLWLLVKYGPRWRKERNEKEEKMKVDKDVAKESRRQKRNPTTEEDSIQRKGIEKVGFEEDKARTNLKESNDNADSAGTTIDAEVAIAKKVNKDELNQ